MATAKKKLDDDIIKLKPTIFPLGFSVGRTEGGVCIIDFVDIIDGKATIIESVALPAEKAEQLSSALTDAIQNGTSEE